MGERIRDVSTHSGLLSNDQSSLHDFLTIALRISYRTAGGMDAPRVGAISPSDFLGYHHVGLYFAATSPQQLPGIPLGADDSGRLNAKVLAAR